MNSSSRTAALELKRFGAMWFAATAIAAYPRRPITAVSGEGRDLVEHGAQVLSMAGSNAHFHAASDRWPGNVNAAGTAAIARAVGRWVALTAAQ